MVINDDKPISKRMKAYLKTLTNAKGKTGMSEGEYERNAGLSIGAISGWGKGLNGETIKKLKAYSPTLDIDWLLTGENPPKTIKKSNREERLEKKNTSSPYQVTLVPAKAQAGYVKNYDNIEFINELDTYGIVPGIDPRGATWRYFEVEGDSMRDTLDPRDFVLCSMVADVDWLEIKDNYIYVVVNDEAPLIKRVVKKRGGKQWILKSDNKDVPEKIINIEEIKEVWKARRSIHADLGPIKKSKHYDLE